MQKQQSIPNFKGLLITNYEKEDSWDYRGIPSSSGLDGGGHYVGGAEYKSYTYYPFKDESEEEIKKELDHNSYTVSYDRMNRDIYSSCGRGLTIPYTREEWGNLCKEAKDAIVKMLETIKK